MSHRPDRRPRRRRRLQQGFSRPVSRQWYDMLGIKREQKREFFNMLSKRVVVVFAMTGGVVGLVEWGWAGGLVLAILGGVFGVWFVAQDRMYR